MQKKYRLLKDTPFHKAGTIFAKDVMYNLEDRNWFSEVHINHEGRYIYHGGCHDCIIPQYKCGGCQYFEAKWDMPDLKTEKVKEVKLEVPIGTKFKTKTDTYIYTILNCNKEDINIDFGGHCVVTIPIEIVNKNFKDGIWTIYKEPLFLDELGNEVFEGDKVFSVCHKYSWEIEDNRSVNKASKFVQDNYKEQAAWKFFKYKEDRDSYVLENKPRFSKKQVLDALDKSDFRVDIFGRIINGLSEISKFKKILDL